MDMYKILQSLQAIEKKTLNESVGSVLDEITSSEFDADALAKHKSRLAREKTRMGLSMPRPDGGPRKSDVPAAARAARGEEPLTLQDLDEADEDCPVTNAIVRRIMASHTDLLSKYGPAKILQAAEAVADSVGMVDEIGTSDVSGWVRQVEQELADQPVNEMTGKEIDYSTLEIDGIDYRDAPDFADAYFSDGYYTDGTQLSDQELDQLSDDRDLVSQYVEKMVYEDNTVNEEPVDYMKGPDSGAEITINGKPAVVLGEIPAQRGSATYYAVQYKDQRYPTRRDGGKTFDMVNVNHIYRDLPSFKNRTQQTEDDVGEGNEFAGKLAKARAIGAEEFEVDGKQYPVKENDGAKPDFLDLDRDGDKKEPMKQAAKDAKQGTAAKSSAAMKGMFGGDAKELTKDLKIREGYADFHDKKMAYQKIGATVDGSAQDYTVTFRDGKRKRYVEKNGRRQVMTLEPVDRQDDTDDEGNVVKRSRGRPAGTGRAMGAKGPTGRSKLMREQDIDLADRGEYDREGDMALNQLHQIADAAEELHSILNAEENLPEWVQSKITKAVDYLDTARDYLKAKKSQYQTRGEEPVAEKAVSRAQQQAAGAALAAKRGEGKAVGASKEMAKMSTKELEKYAGTKHKGLPDKKDESVHEVDTGEADARKTAPSSKKEQDRVFAKSRELAKKEKEDYDADNKDEVEETTTAGSVATGSDKPAKASGIYGKGVYEAAIAESFERKLSQQLNESISINASVSTEGGKNITVTATEEDADKLGELLKMAGLFSSGGYTQVDSQPETCQECGGHGGLHEGECSHRMDEEYANEPDETYSDMDTILNKLAGGLNRPKLQVNPNNPGDNPLAMKKLGKSAHSLNLGDLAEDIKSETRTRLMDLYKSYK
jgi:hypothetical protein